MNRLICLIFALTVSLSSCVFIEKPPDVRYSITEVINTVYTPPDTYEIHYRTVFSDGMCIDRWTVTSKSEYERLYKE